MILTDITIRSRRLLHATDPMRLTIDPFVEKSPPGCISYGLSSGGYDIRLGTSFKVFTGNATVDPKNFYERNFESYEGNTCIIPPNSFALGVSVERLRIPRDVIATCIGKSTYARCGIIANVTPLEPEWEGYITIEMSNTTTAPAVVYAGEGIIQVLFNLMNCYCGLSYADKKGRYQNQKAEVTLPFVK